MRRGSESSNDPWLVAILRALWRLRKGARVWIVIGESIDVL